MNPKVEFEYFFCVKIHSEKLFEYLQCGSFKRVESQLTDERKSLSYESRFPFKLSFC